jgi:hypothetical protein
MLNYNKNEFPRRKRRGIHRKILIAPRGAELNLYPPLEDLSAWRTRPPQAD